MSRFCISILTAVLVGACTGPGEPDQGQRHGQDFLRCAKLYDDGTQEKFSLPPLVVERNGFKVAVRGIKSGQISLGLLAGIAAPTAATLSNVDFFLDEFKKAHVQAILVAGGVGLIAAEVDAILDRLGQAPVPLLICPGAQESFDVFRNAVHRARQKYPQILDMTRVRRVIMGNVNIVSIPGYQNPYYLEAGERGCAYNLEDLSDVAALFDESYTNVVLSPSPPLGTGDNAVDRGRGDINLGDKALASMLRSKKVSFGLFGYAYESGGHATLQDGATPIPPSIWQDALFLQAGAAEAVPMNIVGKGRAVGMAHVVELAGKRGRFRSVLAN